MTEVPTVTPAATGEEIWKPVPGWTMYEVSDMGNVRRGGKNLSLETKVKGYVVVMLYGPGMQRQCKVHRLVAAAFLPPPPDDGNSWTVDHYPDRKNKINNKLSNLRWATKSQQAQNRDRCPNPSKPKKRIDQLSIDGKLMKTWESCVEAVLSTGVSNDALLRCLRGQTETAGGFQWRYTPETIIAGEVWKPLMLKKQTIQVSSHGRIRTKLGIHDPKGDASGYKRVTIDGKRYQVHFLVCLAFKPDEKLDCHDRINHIDKKPWNNRPVNVEWSTAKANSRHAADFGDTKSRKRKVEEIDDDDNVIGEFDSATSTAMAIGVAPSTITNVCNGKSKRAKGRRFQYASTLD